MSKFNGSQKSLGLHRPKLQSQPDAEDAMFAVMPCGGVRGQLRMLCLAEDDTPFDQVVLLCGYTQQSAFIRACQEETWTTHE